MSRRHSAEPRKVNPDAKYESVLLTKFINNVMERGKKSLAESIVYGALATLEKKHKLDSLEAFNTAIGNVKPELEVKSVRVGGSNYQVPCPVDPARGNALAIRWIIKAAHKRSEKTMADKLSEELFEAYNKRGAAIKTQEDTHRMAEANRAFSHYSPKKTKGA